VPHHGGQREHERQPGRDERAERDDQDQQRDRQREELGLLEVLVERLGERLVRARVAELLDPQLRVRALGGGGGGERASTRSLATSSSPWSLKVTSAERPSRESWPALPLA
jgi:hypothetical protein